MDNRALIRKLAEFNPNLTIRILAPNGTDEITLYSVEETDIRVVGDSLVLDLHSRLLTEDSPEEAKEEEETSKPLESTAEMLEEAAEAEVQVEATNEPVEEATETETEESEVAEEVPEKPKKEKKEKAPEEN